MASAWIYQDDKQLKLHGTEGASWYVGWYNLEGKKRCKSCGAGVRGRDKAEKLRRKREAELEGGQYREQLRKTWEEFRKEFEARIGEGMKPETRRLTLDALNHFQRIVRPVKMAGIYTQNLDDYVAERRKEPGKKKGSTVSLASINKELRHLWAVFHVAADWGCLPTMPRFKMLRESKKLVRYIPGDHFARIYQGCESAELPKGQPFPPADWWRALMVMGYMTGWRISDMLGLRRVDMDLEAGTAITRAEDNKGDRDEQVKLHPVVVDHLRKLACFDPYVFPWVRDTKALYKEFGRIQRAAGIELPCNKEHEHTPCCRVYGFHDLRRAFATMNADKLTADALQVLMRHKSYLTTQGYINMARQMDSAVASLHIPDVLRTANRG